MSLAARISLALLLGGCAYSSGATPNPAVHAALRTPDGSSTIGWVTVTQLGDQHLLVYIELIDKGGDTSIQIGRGCSDERPGELIALERPTQGISDTYMAGQLGDFAGLAAQVLDTDTGLMVGCGTL